VSGAARLNNLEYLRIREGRGCGNEDVLCVYTSIARSVFGVWLGGWFLLLWF